MIKFVVMNCSLRNNFKMTRRNKKLQIYHPVEITASLVEDHFAKMFCSFEKMLQNLLAQLAEV